VLIVSHGDIGRFICNSVDQTPKRMLRNTAQYLRVLIPLRSMGTTCDTVYRPAILWQAFNTSLAGAVPAASRTRRICRDQSVNVAGSVVVVTCLMTSDVR
jgi:hypothetical protein